jgi:hypothetical protein
MRPTVCQKKILKHKIIEIEAALKKEAETFQKKQKITEKSNVDPLKKEIEHR